MKYQLIIISALFVSTFAWPVPDEEVSPGQSVSIPEVIKSDIDVKEEQKPVEVLKSETRASIDNIPTDSATIIQPKKTIEENQLQQQGTKVEIPANAPDAEQPQQLADKKEKKIDEKIEEAKALPVVNAPVYAAGIEDQKQVVDELKPAVSDLQNSVKSIDVKKNTPAAATAPIATEPLSTDDSLKTSAPITTSETLSVDNKEEKPARQERGSDNKAVIVDDVKVDNHIQNVAKVPSVVAPDVKNLRTVPEAEEPKAENVAVAESEITESKTILKSSEEKKIDEEIVAPAGDVAEKKELKATKQLAPEENNSTDGDKQLKTENLVKIEKTIPEEESKKPLDDNSQLKNSNESKKDKSISSKEESEESKESDESKEEKKN